MAARTRSDALPSNASWCFCPDLENSKCLFPSAISLQQIELLEVLHRQSDVFLIWFQIFNEWKDLLTYYLRIRPTFSSPVCLLLSCPWQQHSVSPAPLLCTVIHHQCHSVLPFHMVQHLFWKRCTCHVEKDSDEWCTEGGWKLVHLFMSGVNLHANQHSVQCRFESQGLCCDFIVAPIYYLIIYYLPSHSQRPTQGSGTWTWHKHAFIPVWWLLHLSF